MKIDYHLHTSVSFDSSATVDQMIGAAELAGLDEICVTDHFDYNDIPSMPSKRFSIESYRNAYDSTPASRVKLKRGVEAGLTPINTAEIAALSDCYPFDFIIGSVHFVGGYDPYQKEYWQDISVEEGFTKYLNGVLACARVHDSFDVLGHINYACKSPNIPVMKYSSYLDHSDLCDEIMREVIKRGKGIEINTSGVDRVGNFLPSREHIKRFRELGGEIITVGSDAHDPSRVGQYISEATEIAKNIFGYVCTFENRKPIFNKL